LHDCGQRQGVGSGALPQLYRFGLKRCEPPPVVTSSTYDDGTGALPSERIHSALCTALHWARRASAWLNGDGRARAAPNGPGAPTWRSHAACHVARSHAACHMAVACRLPHAACHAVRGAVTARRGGPMPVEARSGSRRGSLCRTRSSRCRTCACRWETPCHTCAPAGGKHARPQGLRHPCRPAWTVERTISAYDAWNAENRYSAYTVNVYNACSGYKYA
jgi:hypothetical protein